MHHKRLLLAIAALSAMPLWASSAIDTRSSSNDLTLDPQQFVEARRTGMRLAAADILLMRMAGEKGAEIRRMVPAARALAQWGNVIPSLFPAGTGPDATRTTARPEIWSNRADFEQKARDFAAAAESLAEAIAAGDMEAGRERWDATWTSCNSCHERFRTQTPPSN